MATILVVEDVPSVMLSLRVVLEGCGHAVVGAATAEEGLGRLRQGGIDLVVTDIWMPGQPGTAVISQGRRLAPGTRFLAITGGAPNGSFTAEDLRREGTDFGADQVLYKPFQRAELIQAVSHLLPA